MRQIVDLFLLRGSGLPCSFNGKDLAARFYWLGLLNRIRNRTTGVRYPRPFYKSRARAANRISTTAVAVPARGHFQHIS